ncbi:MAG: hypothetical protein GC168_08530 [Candidatus Hydrogenedens sp.]|nr:hypothetical protein [Candidatus Hydrogenedens sp.]
MLSSLVVFTIVFLVPRGLAAAVPAPTPEAADWHGVRYCGGVALLALLLYAAALAGVPLHRAAWGIIALAAVGFIVEAGRGAERVPTLSRFLHPLLVFALLVGGLAAWSGGIDYLPHTWDEWANWLGWSRQMIVADRMLSDGMVLSTRGELPGWSLLMSFPGLLLDRWREGDAVPVIFVLHLGCLAVAYDLVRWLARRQLALSEAAATAGAWLWLLALLAAEVTWKLLPTSLLIDEPQVYAVGSVVLLGIAGASPGLGIAGTSPGLDRRRLAVTIGLIAAFAYTLKHAFIVFLPAYGVIAGLLILAEWREGRRSLGRVLAIGAALLLPVAAVRLGWALFGSGGRCFADQLQILRTVAAGAAIFGETPGALMVRILDASAAYLLAWKLPLTVVAGLGLAAALASRRHALAVVALLIYGAAYLFGFFATSLAGCFTEYEVVHLESLTRYIRVPLRVLQLGGCFLLVIVAIDTLSAPGWAVWRRRLGSRPALLAAVVLALPLLAWQTVQVSRSLVENALRVSRAPAEIAHFRRTAALGSALADLMAARGLGHGRVGLIAQGRPGDEKPLVQYTALGRRRGDALARFTVDGQHSWARQSDHFVTVAATEAELRTALLTRDVIFPIVVDDWISGILVPLIRTPGCQGAVTGFFLFRTADRRGFTCVLKPKVQ